MVVYREGLYRAILTGSIRVNIVGYYPTVTSLYLSKLKTYISSNKINKLLKMVDPRVRRNCNGLGHHYFPPRVNNRFDKDSSGIIPNLLGPNPKVGGL